MNSRGSGVGFEIEAKSLVNWLISANMFGFSKFDFCQVGETTGSFQKSSNLKSLNALYVYKYMYIIMEVHGARQRSPHQLRPD